MWLYFGFDFLLVLKVTVWVCAVYAQADRPLVEPMTGRVAKNMVQPSHFDLPRSERQHRPVAGSVPYRARRAVVLGGGMMGSAIAYVAARAGIDVVLTDTSLELAERGRAHAEGLVAAAVAQGHSSAEQGEALLGRITVSASPADAAGADLVIEAVFEDRAVKAAALAEIEPHLDPGALLGSNTSTLPISDLAEHVPLPAQFIGLHFFSPVEKMALLEIVKGKRTSVETVDRALDLAAQLGKTPIVVNDSRGFFASRVIATFIHEAIGMLTEGIAPLSIEQAATQAGYPTSPLALSDELNLTLLRRIRRQYKAAAAAEGVAWPDQPSERVIDAMIDVHGRFGRHDGAGFYDYVARQRTGLWPGLSELAAAAPTPLPLRDLAERMLFIEALEAVKCLDEDVIESVADANIGSLLGIGFPAWSGGVLQYINGYAGGPAGFVERSRELAASYGERFNPPASLVELASRGSHYSDDLDGVPSGAVAGVGSDSFGRGD
jgi:3-hydroxyacyl-CoA dehydrogenase/enoyl-CoA hydratase/3-hydroxybutyryl-CoA epimerase